MRHACEISSSAHVAAMKHANPNIGEWQLEAILEGFLRFAGASGIAYPSIVGCGDNATILHYNSNQMSCGDGEVVLIDAGGEYRGYAADITRSWPINGKFSPAQREIYELVLKAQLAAKPVALLVLVPVGVGVGWGLPKPLPPVRVLN